MKSSRLSLQSSRRRLLMAAAAGLPWPLVQASEKAAVALRRGGLVLLMRHALAPGTFDPPEFRLGDCRTQRNLNDEGRAQAQRIGQWFAARGLKPRKVQSSPWCRCLDTATLAFGRAQAWTALGSPRGFSEGTNDEHLGQLRRALREASAAAGFEVWVSHMFVQQALAGQGAGSGEALMLRSGGDGSVQVLGRLQAG